MIDECNEIGLINSLMNLIHWWEGGQLFPVPMLMEWKEMISETCAYYGIDLGTDFYQHMINISPTYVDPILAEYKECMLIAKAEKVTRDYSGLCKFLKESKDQIEIMQLKPNLEGKKAKYSEMYDKATEFNEKSYTDYEMETKASLYLEKLW